MSTRRIALTAFALTLLGAAPASAAVTLTSPADGASLSHPGTPSATYQVTDPDLAGTAEAICRYVKADGTTVEASLGTATIPAPIQLNLSSVQEKVCALRVRRQGGGTSAEHLVTVDLDGASVKTITGSQAMGATAKLDEGLVETRPFRPATPQLGHSLFDEAGAVTGATLDGVGATAVLVDFTRTGATTTVVHELQTVAAQVELTRTYASESDGRVVVVTDRVTSLDGSPHTVVLPFDIGVAPAGSQWRLPGGSFATGAGSPPAPATVPATIGVRADAGVFPDPSGAVVLAGKPSQAMTFASANRLGARATRTTPGKVTHAFVTEDSQSDADALAAALQSRFAPSLTLNAPASTEAASVAVTGAVPDSGNGRPASIVVNGATVPLAAGGGYSATVPLQPGANTITATLTDPGGATATATRSVTRTVPDPPAQPPSTPPAVTPPAVTPPAVTALSPTLSFGQVRYDGKLLNVGLRCAATGGACGGELVATVTEKVKKRNGKTVSRTYTAGRASFDLPAGNARTLKLKLSKKAAAQLKLKKSLALKLVATSEDLAGTKPKSVTRTYTAKPPAKKKAKR